MNSLEERYFLKNMLRLIVTPSLSESGVHYDRFDVFFEGVLLVRATRQPLYDGARALIDQGYSPEMFVTFRHDGASHDSFKPMKLGEAAKWTVEERDKKGLRRTRWKPMGMPREGTAGTPERATTV